IWAVALLAACPGGAPPCETGAEESCPLDEPPPDVCNSREEALSDPACALTLGQARLDFLSFSGDQDWFSAKLPGDLTARSLLHVLGGYGAPNTPVSLSLNVLREDGAASIAHEVDKHGAAAPRPVDIILPFSEANA